MATQAELRLKADQYANQYGIPPSIFAAMIDTESSWNPNAQASGSSAFGLTQLIKGTAAQVGVTDITDVDQQLEGGAKYLSSMYQKFGSWARALGAYNQGPGGVDTAAAKQYSNTVLSKVGQSSQNVLYDAQGNVIGYGDDATQGDYSQEGAKATTLIGFITEKLGDVGLVLIGVVVVGIALISSTKVQETAVKAVTKGVV